MNFNRFIVAASLLSFAFLIYYSAAHSAMWLLYSYLYYKVVVGLLGNQIAQHRYFSHNSFSTSGWKRKFLYFVSLTTGVSPAAYAIVHRHHHVHSDTASDLHSWKNSIYDIFFPLTNLSSYGGKVKISSALDPELRKINKHHEKIILGALAVSFLINWKITVFLLLAGIGWNYLHMILFRVFLVHYKLPMSYRNFGTGDNSWNNKIIQVLDFGEGLHNNHHYDPSSFDQAMVPGEFDPAGWIVRTFFEKTT